MNNTYYKDIDESHESRKVKENIMDQQLVMNKKSIVYSKP